MPLQFLQFYKSYANYAFSDRFSLRCEVLGIAFPNYGNLKIYKFLWECYAPTIPTIL